MNIKFFNKTILIYLLLTASVWGGEITSFSEKKFFQLFPTKVCDQIYEKLNYGEDELEGDILVEVNQDINALTVDEYKNIFSINFSERRYSYTEDRLKIILTEISSTSRQLMQVLISIAYEKKNEKIVICEYDLNKSIYENKFFDPKIFFKNAWEIKSKNQNKILVYYDGTIEYQYKDETINYFIPQFNYKAFPFDDHGIKISIASLNENLRFEKSTEYLSLLEKMKKNKYEDISTPGWSIKSLDSYVAMDAVDTSVKAYKMPSLETTIRFQRNWFTYLIKFIIPMILITLLTFGALYLRLEHGRAGIAGTLLITYVAYNFVLNNKLPNLLYITFMDTLVLSGYVFCIINIVLLYFLSAISGTNFAKKNYKTVNLHCRFWPPALYIASILISGRYLIN